MNPEDLVAAAPVLLRLAGVEPTAEDLERVAILLRRRGEQRLPALATEPLLVYDVPFWKLPWDVRR